MASDSLILESTTTALPHSALARTRTVELPFPPFDGLRLFARGMDQCPYPPGFPLKDVTWDMKRGTFLADTHLSIGDSVAMIPATLADYRVRGGKPGSYQDYYDKDDDDVSNDASRTDAPAGNGSAGHLDLEPDELERLETMPPPNATSGSRMWR